MITYKKGNLLEDKAFVLVNTVNTVGIMGKGIALTFKKQFPFNYECYKYACKTGMLNIGGMLCIEDNSMLYGNKLIVNFPTKKHWRNPSEYQYIEAGLKALAYCMTNFHIKSIAIPPLGCGNGGLNWQIVKPMIEKHLSVINADIVIYEPAY